MKQLKLGYKISWLMILFVCMALSVISSITLAQQSTPNPIFVPLVQPSLTPNSAVTSKSTPSLDSEVVYTSTQIPEPAIEKQEHHVLMRPISISADSVHWVDRTYPYGGTSNGQFEVHTGVEFVNPRYTPVLSAEAGEVVFAGSDSETIVGAYANYYGNAVIIAHELNTLDGLQVFTLYGHLERVDVAVGDIVEAHQRIGRVGSSGIAAGAHLHFEVRAGNPFDFFATRNPELWIQYYVDHGSLAGFVHDTGGNPVYGKRIVVRSASLNREIFSYGNDRVNSDPVWRENFFLGDLPAGDYEIVMLNKNGGVNYRNTVTVIAYKTTFVDIVDN